MSNTTLKIIACVSMLIDHIGYILFPDVFILRCIGRIAMPIFAFFIGQGCRYTKNKIRYFSQVFILGIVCQFFSVANDLITGKFDEFNGNILLTFSMSIVICFAYIHLENAYKDKQPLLKPSALFVLCVLGAYCILRFTDNVFEIPFHVDYGMRGVLLPLCACAFTKKSNMICAFSIGLLLPMIMQGKNIYYILFATLSLVLLYFYNGKYGNKKLKYLFYVFYPLHLGILHLISLAI